ncbi:uncharacterized protein LOC115231804 [Octopus sinensis]|uniref:Uncharacterized protein LOC115231804 n=1 Tax=Octopus sinensis TaxID=2607531 RepID=A0A6P7U5K9_9MOLL|nr:uncharacterized protein LOC115231804 [Octopus sinensis]
MKIMLHTDTSVGSLASEEATQKNGQGFLRFCKELGTSLSGKISVIVDDEKIECVESYIFLGSLITRDGGCDSEINRRMAMCKSMMIKLNWIWSSKDVSLKTKIRLVNAIVFPVFLYGCESWTLSKAHSKEHIYVIFLIRFARVSLAM